jgi:hypothetical protein
MIYRASPSICQTISRCIKIGPSAPKSNHFTPASRPADSIPPPYSVQPSVRSTFCLFPSMASFFHSQAGPAISSLPARQRCICNLFVGPSSIQQPSQTRQANLAMTSLKKTVTTWPHSLLWYQTRTTSSCAANKRCQYCAASFPKFKHKRLKERSQAG